MGHLAHDTIPFILYNLGEWLVGQWPPIREITGRWLIKPMSSLLYTYLMNGSFGDTRKTVYQYKSVAMETRKQFCDIDGY